MQILIETQVHVFYFLLNGWVLRGVIWEEWEALEISCTLPQPEPKCMCFFF